MAQTGRSNVRYVDPQRRYTVVLGPSWNAPFEALPHDGRAGTHDSADGRCGAYASIGRGQAPTKIFRHYPQSAVCSPLEFQHERRAAGDGASWADGLTARCHSRVRWARVAVRDFGWAEDRNGSDSVIRRCRLNVRFARKRTRLKGAPRSVRHTYAQATHAPRPAPKIFCSAIIIAERYRRAGTSRPIGRSTGVSGRCVSAVRR
jgi:hypothetical protein